MIVTKMPKKAFDALPEYSKEMGTFTFNSLVIIPTKTKCGEYMAMDYVPCDIELKPICRISTTSDVVCIDGIGGWGEKNNGWRIDCLPCGYLRLFARGTLYFDEAICSYFEIFCGKMKEEK